MANGKAWFGRTLGKYLFEHTTIAAVTPIGGRFRRLDLVGPSLATTTFRPGDKVQVFVGDDGMRTYTPFDWDRASGKVSLLVFVRDESPGSRLGRDARVGDAVDFFGPRGSIDLDGIAGEMLLVGDETSFALARTAGLRHPGARALIEVDSLDEGRAVVEALGLEGVDLVLRAPGDGHLPTIAKRLLELTRPTTTLVWSGRAKSIQGLRKALDATAVRPRKNLAKAYWAEGRRGID